MSSSILTLIEIATAMNLTTMQIQVHAQIVSWKFHNHMYDGHQPSYIVHVVMILLISQMMKSIIIHGIQILMVLISHAVDQYVSIVTET